MGNCIKSRKRYKIILWGDKYLITYSRFSRLSFQLIVVSLAYGDQLNILVYFSIVVTKKIPLDQNNIKWKLKNSSSWPNFVASVLILISIIVQFRKINHFHFDSGREKWLLLLQFEDRKCHFKDFEIPVTGREKLRFGYLL